MQPEDHQYVAPKVENIDTEEGEVVDIPEVMDAATRDHPRTFTRRETHDWEQWGSDRQAVEWHGDGKGASTSIAAEPQVQAQANVQAQAVLDQIRSDHAAAASTPMATVPKYAPPHGGRGVVVLPPNISVTPAPPTIVMRPVAHTDVPPPPPPPEASLARAGAAPPLHPPPAHLMNVTEGGNERDGAPPAKIQRTSRHDVPQPQIQVNDICDIYIYIYIYICMYVYSIVCIRALPSAPPPPHPLGTVEPMVNRQPGYHWGSMYVEPVVNRQPGYHWGSMYVEPVVHRLVTTGLQLM